MNNRYSIFSIYPIMVKAFRSFRHLRSAQKAGLMDDQFKERIMLAVTAVNRCPMCTYAHTEMALQSGLSDEEVRSFVSGDFPDIPQDQVKAILFAQHYANRHGHPQPKLWYEVLNGYHRPRAYAILAAIRIIMLGNATGVIIGSFLNRIKGRKPDRRSSLPYELGFLVCFLPMLLLSVLQALVSDLLHLPYDGI